MSTNAKGRPARPAQLAKKRTTVSFSEDVVTLGGELASRERRSFSNMLEVLVVREHARVVRTEASTPQPETVS